MKKNARKLDLRSDTIRSLGALDLGLAQGGMINQPKVTQTCDCPNTWNCSVGIVCATTRTAVC